jgi:dTDP-4-dehydrorhamnose reductase
MSTIPPKVLIVGGDSLIGTRLSKELLTRGNVLTFSITRAKSLDTNSTILENFDLSTNPSTKFNDLIRNYNSIIFLSGINNTKYIANNYQQAKEINVKQTIKWIKFLTQNGTPIIFPSSSLVYEESYLLTEESTTLPKSAYANFKLEVETVLQETDINVTIPRFTKILSAKQPLIQKWIESLRKKENVKAYFDCQISPLAIDQAVNVLICLALDSKLQNSRLINISGARDVSFFHFAKILAQSLNLNSDLVIPTDSGGELISKQFFATLQTFKANQLFNFCPQTPEQVVESLKSEIEGSI